MRLLTERQLLNWKRMRAGGRTRFIVRRGMIGWGVPTAVLFSILTVWSDPGVANFGARLALALVVFPLCGFLWGAIIWRMSETAYAKSEGASAAAPPRV